MRRIRCFGRSFAVRRTCKPLSVLACHAVLVAVGCTSTLPQRFQANIDYLASDRLQGRGLGSDGIEMAAEYIAEQFGVLGLEPGGDHGSFFQTFQVTVRRELADDGHLEIPGANAGPLIQGRDFIPLHFTSDDSFEGTVVFCGYGIQDEDRGHDDFQRLDLTGKVALLLRGEPDSWRDDEGYPTRHASFRNKVYNAKDRGAVAVLIVSKTPAKGEGDELQAFASGGAEQYGLPAFHVKRSVAEGMLTAGKLRPLSVLERQLDDDAHVSAELTGVHASGQAVIKRTCASTSNVIGILEGEGPEADEFVVIGAHYDHLGIQVPMLRKFKAGQMMEAGAQPQIHNGADDNASGVSGLIEIACLFSHEKRPRRSVLFIAFTGEETGVHGSRYFVEHPTVPLDGIVAMINLDMIGRLKPGSTTITAIHARTAGELGPIIEAAAANVGLDVELPSSPAGGSDQMPFIENGIPAVHFFSGFHDDYHKPSDDSDKINADGGAKIVMMVHDVANQIANREERLTFQRPKSSRGQSDDLPTYRVVMGLTPDIAGDDGPGMLVHAVSPDGPAEMAGMKAKDRIIRIAGKDVSNIFDYMASTRRNKPGDTVEVVILRGGEELKLEVTLAGAR